MPGDSLPGSEGGGVMLGRNGRRKRWSFSSRDPVRTQHQGSSHPVDVGNECSLNDPAYLVFRTGFLSLSSGSKEFKTKRDVAMRVVSSVFARQFFLLCLVSIQRCAWFYGSCLSNIPASSLSADEPVPLSLASYTTVTAVVPTELADTDRAKVSAGELAALEKAAFSLSERPPVGRASSVVTTSEKAKPAIGGSSFYQGSTDAATNDGVASNSLISMEQTTARPLPAGYQTYRQMLGVLRTLASSTCPELKLTERRSGQVKIDVLSLKRTTTDDESRKTLSQPQLQKVFILAGEHPRELVSPAVLLRFVQLVCGAQPPAALGVERRSSMSSAVVLPSAAADAVEQQQKVEETEGDSGTEEGEKRQREQGPGNEQAQFLPQDSSGSDNSSDSEEGQREGGRQGEDPSRFPNLLSKAEFQIILNANPLARDKLEEGDLCKRGTLSNVDLNRNWSAFWEADTTEEPDSARGQIDAATGETAIAAGENLTGGPSPFSEAETQILKQVLLQFQPNLFISLHSGQLGIFTPFGHSEQRPATHGRRLQLVAEKVAHSPHCKNIDSDARCVTGIAGKYFSAKGNCLDWVYTNIKPTPLAFLMEIYKAEGAAPTWPSQPVVPFPERPENGEKFAQTENEGEKEEGKNERSASTLTGADSEPETPPDQYLTFVQTGADRGKGHRPRFWGVDISENTFSTQETSTLMRQRFRTPRLARVSPHYSLASFKEKNRSMLQWNSGSRRPVHLSSREGHVSLSSSSPSLSNNSNNSSKQEKTTEWSALSRASLSLLEARNDFSGSDVAGASAQPSSAVRTPEQCFRLFNPHTFASREEALNRWSEVLRQLIEEVQSTANVE